jgi:hypothetical protein
MIKISSFHPTSNFLHITYEFLDDKLVIKQKSLTAEFEAEIKYEKIKVIQNRRIADLNWLKTGFILFIILGFFPLIFGSFYHNNLIIQLAIKAIAIAGVILCIPTFHKDDYYSFLDIDRNNLTTVRVNNNSRKLLNEAINLIKQKTKIISETKLTDSLPDTPSIFEITQHDIPDFLNKSVTRFYEDRLIDSEQSLIENLVTEVKYSELSGKTQLFKGGNEKWSALGWLWLFFIGAFFLLIVTFSPQPTKLVVQYSYLYWSGTILSIPMFILRYRKKEALLFYNTNDQVVWWTRPTAANRKKLEQIVEFIQTKTSPNPKD